MAFDFGLKEFKGSFFDTAAVQKATTKLERQVLSKFGAFARQRIRSSIRKAPMVDVKTGKITRGRKAKGAKLRPAISAPGKPPYSHEGSYRRLIFFAYDHGKHSVVIGPVKFKRGDVPRLLEFGGTVQRNGRTLTYRPRPHIKPAVDEELKRFPQTLRRNVKV